MKILQIGPIPPEVGGKTVGGVATHVWDLSRHLVKRGHEVAILADNFPSHPQIPLVKEGVKIYGFSKISILKRLHLILPNLYTIYKLRKHLRDLIGITWLITNFCFYKYVINRFVPDIIHIHHLESRFPFAYFASKGKIPIVTTIHSFNAVKFLNQTTSERYRQLIEKNINLSSYLIFPSKFISDELDGLFRGSFKGKRWIITNPIDISRYYPISKDKARSKIGMHDKGPIILFVGNLNKKKGIYVLVETAIILRHKGLKYKVLIVGGGEEKKKLEEFIKANSVEDTVSLEGVKYLPELLYYYNAADLFVMPSLSEGWGYVFGEAMLCGVPVIGTDTPGIRDVLTNENCSILVKPNDPIVLAEEINKGLDKNWDKEQIIKYAQTFSWEKRIKEFEKVYRYISGVGEL